MVGVRVHTGDRTPIAWPAITRTVTPSAVVHAMSLL
uniref:Pirin, putative n=1 Tax=Arundo donax TaxID=35708 RepID=A0A0A9EE59_ARUDO